MTLAAQRGGGRAQAGRLAVALALAWMAGPATASEPPGAGAGPRRYARYDELDLLRARRALAALERLAPQLRRPLAEAAGYAVFATGDVGASGVLFVSGQAAGKATLSYDLPEPQAGQLPSSLVIFLQDRRALRRFERAGLSPAARARAVRVVAGQTVRFGYVGGVGVVTLGEGGVPAVPRTGRQAFRYLPYHRTIVARPLRGCEVEPGGPVQPGSGSSVPAGGGAEATRP